ncbi:DUF3139 domain-containing protein [Paenibacillus wenxiniae]|uniref:DUF3139 domain-containing protein n=1 Tax=Paenibacillus wenxiniae TaxID=1636843 RepID=A0ABW4REN3_9BACL
MSSRLSSPTESTHLSKHPQTSSTVPDHIKGRFSRPHPIVRFILTTLLVLIIIGCAASPFIAVHYQKQVFAERVHTYLIQHEHYKLEEIASVQGVWGIMLPTFYVDVVFTDEPNRVYTYFAHDEVLQHSHRAIDASEPDQTGNSKAQHIEETTSAWQTAK